MPSDFEEFLNDTIKIIKEDGRILENIKAQIEDNEILIIADDSIDIDSDDVIQRILPNKKIEEYIVIDPSFTKGMDGIPDTYHVKVRRSNNSKQNDFEKEARNFFYDQIRYFKHGIGHRINWRGIMINAQEQPPHVRDILKKDLLAKMGQEGLLDNTFNNLTEKGYIEAYKARDIETKQTQILYNQHNEFHSSGMVQQGSTNSSMTMIINNNQLEVFDKMLEVAKNISNNNSIIKDINEMKKAIEKNDNPTFKEKYNNFIQSAANHMTLFVPFISELTKFF